jgi:peroxiredoxin
LRNPALLADAKVATMRLTLSKLRRGLVADQSIPLAMVIMFLLTWRSSLNALGAPPPAEKPVDAAALVREVRAAEAWVDTVKSLSFKTERDGKYPEKIAMGVNQPLGDAPFKWDFIEGVDVTDLRHDPVLRYKYKKHFEPIEWEAILEEAHQQEIRRQPDTEKWAAHNDALGRGIPEFPADSKWINSPPIKAAELKGKVVIVECWASWSKYCWEDMAKMNKQFESGDKDVVVISVHAAGTPVEELQKWVKEHGIKYPVCIDSPGDKGPWDGTLFNAYHVIEVPTAYVIDRQGRVRSWSDSFDAGMKIVRQTIKAPAK